MFDPGAFGADPSHVASTVCAMSVSFACAGAIAVTMAPAAGFVANWLRLAWRAQANAARRKSVRDVAAIDNRRTPTCAFAQLTPLTAARSDAMNRT
eukprot:858921-Pleurochrysis_carterae.AAC.1